MNEKKIYNLFPVPIFHYKIENYKEIIMNKLFEIYIKTNLYQEDFIGILIYQLINKFNKYNKN